MSHSHCSSRLEQRVIADCLLARRKWMKVAEFSQVSGIISAVA